MSQLFKYFLVALIFLGIGALTGILIYNHLSPATFLKEGLHKAKQTKDLTKKIPSDLKGGSNEKNNKTGGDKEGGVTDSAPEMKDNKIAPKNESEGSQKQGASEEAAKGGSKKEEGKEKEDDSTEYLRSLWPIKKRRLADISEETRGKLYLEGTNPYGPPPTYKEDLFSETKALTLAGDPPTKIPPPLRKTETFEPLPKNKPQRDRPTLYQVEIGRFSSIEKAQKACDVLRSKGENIDIYYTGSITDPDWFYARLSSSFTKPQAYKKAQNLAILEKIVPTIVRVSADVKKIK